MSKHTPGPWLKIETRTEGFVITYSVNLIVHSVDEYGHYGPIKNLANAYLIAAAPELLEALELLTTAAEYGSRAGSDDIRKAQIAIAKAKGDTHVEA